jgi:hypothetical protein
MQIIDNAVILALIVLAFIAGMKISDRYHANLINEYQYIQKIMAAQKGLGYIAPPVKKPIVQIGQPFMDRLKENGRATQILNQKSAT